MGFVFFCLLLMIPIQKRSLSILIWVGNACKVELPIRHCFILYIFFFLITSLSEYWNCFQIYARLCGILCHQRLIVPSTLSIILIEQIMNEWSHKKVQSPKLRNHYNALTKEIIGSLAYILYFVAKLWTNHFLKLKICSRDLPIYS